MTQDTEPYSTSSRLIIIEWITLGAMLIGSFYYLHCDINRIDQRIEQRIVSQEQRILSQEQRSDRLYEMFIQLLKDQKS